MAQDSSQHASKRLQDRLKTASRGQGASQGGPREAKILQTPKENQCFWPSRLFASDGLLRPQDGSKMAQEGPKRGPRGPQEGLKSGPRGPQDWPKSAPRGPQEAHLKAPTGGAENYSTEVPHIEMLKASWESGGHMIGRALAGPPWSGGRGTKPDK